MQFAASLSTAREPTQAINEVCAEVMKTLGGPPEIAVVFYSPEHIPASEMIAVTLQARLQPAGMIGCLGESIIGNAREVEGEPALALWAGNFGGRLQIEPFRLNPTNTPDGPSLLGWPDGLLDADPAQTLMLLLGDPYTFPTSEFFLPRMNEDYRGVPVVGGMASNPGPPVHPTLLLNGEVIREGAVGLLLSGPRCWRTLVSQGARPIGRPMVVTRGHENILFELGGRPVGRYLQELYEELPDDDKRLFEQGLLIGIAMSEYRDQFGRGDYLIRNLSGIDRQTGALVITDRIRTGQTVQFQVRDAATADEELRGRLDGMKQTGPKPAAGLLFSCNGRGSRMFTTPNHDAEAVQESIGPIPLAGFFAAGELGPVGDKNFIHGFTASLVIFD